MDVTLGNEGHTGELFVVWCKEKMNELPYLRSLVFLLKTLLHKYGLNIPFQGGIGSYVLILMTSAFLKMSRQLPSVGHYFLEILRYYGEEFKSEQMMIIGGEYITIPKTTPLLDDLTVIDPFTMNTNAASRVKQFVQVKEVFLKVYKKISALSEQYDPKVDTKLLNKILY